MPPNDDALPKPPLALAPGQAYDKDYAYDEYDEAYYRKCLRNEQFRSHKWRLRWVEECLAPKAGEKFIDLGCGPGVLAKYIASKGATVHGVDLSDIAVKTARQLNDKNPNTTFEVCDASNCAHLPSASFDKGYSCDVTEHCGYDIMCGIFREAHRLIKPGGLYFVYTPNPGCWIEVLKKHDFILKYEPTHTGLRSADVIIEALGSQGWQIERHLKPPSFVPVLNWFEKLWSLQPVFRQLAIYRVVLLARKPGR